MCHYPCLGSPVFVGVRDVQRRICNGAVPGKSLNLRRICRQERPEQRSITDEDWDFHKTGFSAIEIIVRITGSLPMYSNPTVPAARKARRETSKSRPIANTALDFAAQEKPNALILA